MNDDELLKLLDQKDFHRRADAAGAIRAACVGKDDSAIIRTLAAMVFCARAQMSEIYLMRNLPCVRCARTDYQQPINKKMGGVNRGHGAGVKTHPGARRQARQ